MLQDQYRAIMQYSIPKEGHGSDRPPGTGKASQDWYCVKVSSKKNVNLIIAFPKFGK